MSTAFISTVPPCVMHLRSRKRPLPPDSPNPDSSSPTSSPQPRSSLSKSKRTRNRTLSSSKPTRKRQLSSPSRPLLQTQPDAQSQIQPKLSGTLPNKITALQINRIRLRGCFPRAPTALSEAIPFLCHALISIQAQDCDATLHQIWNRLPRPRPSRAELWRLSLNGPETAGVVRIWAQRCTLQLVVEEDWGILSACVKKRLRKMRENSTDKYDLTHVLHELEARFEEEMDSGAVSSKELDQWIVEKGIGKVGKAAPKNDEKFMLKYGVPVLLSIDGKAYRVMGEGNRVCMKKARGVKKWDEDEALAVAAERYFTAYGPATEGDFRYWMYVTAAKSKKAVERAVREGKVVEFGGMLIGKERVKDVEDVVAGNVEVERVMLVGRFDAMVLAHKDKGWIVDERFRRKIWSMHSEVSASVFVDGRIVGKWKHKSKMISVSLFNVELEEGIVEKIEEKGKELLERFYESGGEVVIEWEEEGVGDGK